MSQLNKIYETDINTFLKFVISISEIECMHNYLFSGSNRSESRSSVLNGGIRVRSRPPEPQQGSHQVIPAGTVAGLYFIILYTVNI